MIFCSYLTSNCVEVSSLSWMHVKVFDFDLMEHLHCIISQQNLHHLTLVSHLSPLLFVHSWAGQREQAGWKMPWLARDDQ